MGRELLEYLMERHELRYLVLGLLFLVSGVVACVGFSGGSVAGFKLEPEAQWECSTATPIATDTALPTATTTYPIAYFFNTDWNPVPTLQTTVYVRYAAQGQGSMSYWDNYLMTTVYAGSVPYGPGPFYGSFPVYFPTSMTTLYVTVYYPGGAATLTFTHSDPGYYNPFYPCWFGYCMPPGIIPTPMATYTPIPTATPIIKKNDFFLNDWVVNRDKIVGDNTPRVAIRMEPVNSPNSQLAPGIPAQRLDFQGNKQWIYVWKVRIKNIGPRVYDVFPYLQSYISDMLGPYSGSNPFIVTPPPPSIPGVWGPDAYALNEVMPGETIRGRELGTCVTWITSNCFIYNYDGDNGGGTQSNPGPYPLIEDSFILAAYGPPNQVPYRIGYALDMTQRPTPGAVVPPGVDVAPTQVAGNYIIHWINFDNPYPWCKINNPVIE